MYHVETEKGGKVISVSCPASSNITVDEINKIASMYFRGVLPTRIKVCLDLVDKTQRLVLKEIK